MAEGTVSVAAYDTAWIARLPQATREQQPAFPEALHWLRVNQHPDGSWGGRIPYTYDRFISTLAAVLSLAYWDQEGQDTAAWSRGLDYLNRIALRLTWEPYETVGFELIIPTLLEEAQALGLAFPYERLAEYARIRARKLQQIPLDMLYNRRNPALYSLEFMGRHLDRERAAHIQEANGSIANSPSATAYFLWAWGEEPRARSYLQRVMELNQGGAVPCFPIEVFEKAWVLYNLERAGLLEQLREEAYPHVQYLRQAWDNQEGVSFSRWYSARDLDDTAVTFRVLRRAAQLWSDPDYRVLLTVFDAYAEKDHFRTFPFETDPSLSANIHLLEALQTCPEESNAPAMRATIVSFLRRTRSLGTFWFDKWHASPYYATSHAILAAIGYDESLIADATFWILHTQREDGSWGYFEQATVEETAYCLQALAACQLARGNVSQEALDRAARYLRAHREGRDHPPLWISKVLFAPYHIIESAVISALALYEKTLRQLDIRQAHQILAQ